jgi:indolepyruvate ferredoxin oxidoreductase, beta subunit
MSNLATPINFIITGVGGQGNVLAARLLAAAILSQGLEVTVGDVYGLTQRGGSVASHVRWTSGPPLPPLVPRDALDIVLAFEPMEGLRILSQFGHPDTRAIVNQTPVLPIGVQAGRFTYPRLDDLYGRLENCTTEIRLVKASGAARRTGNIQVLNMVMLGALLGSGFIGNRTAIFEETIETMIPPKYVEINLRAFHEGIRLMKA